MVYCTSKVSLWQDLPAKNQASITRRLGLIPKISLAIFECLSKDSRVFEKYGRCNVNTQAGSTWPLVEALNRTLPQRCIQYALLCIAHWLRPGICLRFQYIFIQCFTRNYFTPVRTHIKNIQSLAYCQTQIYYKPILLLTNISASIFRYCNIILRIIHIVRKLIELFTQHHITEFVNIVYCIILFEQEKIPSRDSGSLFYIAMSKKKQKQAHECVRVSLFTNILTVYKVIQLDADEFSI